MTLSPLTQAVADALLRMEKHRVDDEVHSFPSGGECLTVPLRSADHREDFLLDINRGRINLNKITYQGRGRQVVVLARLDVHGPPHRNPDGTEVPSPHLHVYKEGFGDKWAIPVDASRFPNIEDIWRLMGDFMDYLNVVTKPRIERGLFL